MALTNLTISKKIREAREQLGLTQKDLAAHLKRTSAAISDLERGKVQVTAVDLHKLASVLKKPLEYFYGEDFGGKDLEDLVGLMRRTTPEDRKNSIDFLRAILQLESISHTVPTTTDKQEQWQMLKDFVTTYQGVMDRMQKLSTQGQALQAMLMGILTPENEAKFIAEGKIQLDEATEKLITEELAKRESNQLD